MIGFNKLSKLDPVRVEFWVWVLIYAGLVLLSLGLFMPRVGLGAVLGWVLIAGGGLVAALGVFMIYLRSVMAEPSLAPKTEQLTDKDKP